jgi:hypothetical protein
MANKRKIISQLPVVNQTDALSTFFSATADQLFQPGESEYLSGYIGQKPIYYNPATDFYIPEGNALRTEYQLEPGMVSMNSGGIITDTLTYDDLLNYLNYKGAVIKNNSRLFEGDYYSWAPPVDLDKINNYNQYLWMGSLTTQERYLTTINLYAPRATYFYSGNGVDTFSLPPIIPGIMTETPAVLVNGVLVPSNALGDNETISIDVTGLAVGTIIETMRYGNIQLSMKGSVQFDYTPFLVWEATTPYLGLSGYGFIPRFYNIGELVYVSGNLYICNTAHTALNFVTQIVNWTVLGETFTATTGSKIRPVDSTQILGGYLDNQPMGSISALSPILFFVDGVGSSILLTTDYTADVGGSTPQYIVIDRRSLEGSPWTRRNVWVHQTTLTWTGLSFASRKAIRQIIEFLPNIQMFNYGFNRQSDVQGVLSNTTATAFDNFGIYSSDDNLIGDGQIKLSGINGQFFGRLHENQYDNSGITDAEIIGSVQVDNGYVLQPIDRLLVSQPISNEPLLNEAIYTVISNADTLMPSGGRNDIIQLIPEPSPNLGDIVRVVPGLGTLTANSTAISVFADYDEYWFNGIQWILAQPSSSFPLFELYDSEENALDDQNIYPGSNFSGSRLFGYLIGSNNIDSVLGFALTLDQYGQPIFEIDSVENRVTYDGGTIQGFYYHKFVDNDTYSNNWFVSPTSSSQQLINGVYTIPSNLQANPGNLEITQISRNQWYEQFSEIMSSQVGFTGFPFSINNWRDTEKYLGYGKEILQHRSPLLKTMLICENGNYDLLNSLNYAEQEYIRFRNRFTQAIVNFNNDGTLTSSDTPNVWVSTILEQLRLNKSISIANSTTISFPFWGSSMGGGQYFIPPTPSSMNLAVVTTPAIIVDTTFSPSVTMIRGHDGSMVPAYGDYRDNIILALEQLIYNNIPSSFSTEKRPVFDVQYYFPTISYINENGYYSYEILGMLEPFFQRWVQSNRLDFRTNTSFDAGDPFTWNYSSCVDINNQSLPGYWRGIYRYYFNTDRPNIAPWEMLGFGEMPIWWTATYGPAPYTSGNTKLWNDMATGTIAAGPRMGVDPRYVNSTLLANLPVDVDGVLLDPIACGLVKRPPDYLQSSADWVFGDGSPVETLWINSPSYKFSLAKLSFLMKPSRFVEQGWDTINNIQDGSGQWIYALTGNRPKDSELIIHGEVNSSGKLTVALGVQQWISDYIVSKGQNPSDLGNAIRGLDVRLIHKLAGFTTGDNLQVVAESFGLIENSSDITIQLYNSAPINEQFYSGVLIEKVEFGWRVIGYDVLNSYFYIIPEDVNGPKGVITLATTPEPVINPWRSNTYYRIGINVAYENTIYTCKSPHTSGLVFETKFWTAVSALPERAPRVITYENGNGTIKIIPYGTVFSSYQDVANFLLGYERYLVNNGWSFTSVDSSTQITSDWSSSVKEFLAWSQVNWQVGNFITLSPGASELTFITTHGAVLDVLSPNNYSYGMIDRAGLPISRKNVIVNRTDDTTVFLSKNNDIYGTRVTIGEVEHALIFNNFTIFGDVLYEPQFNLRQPRLLLQGPRSMNWNGRLDIPGYILVKSGITSNFDKAAVDLLTMFDIEKGNTANAILTNHARLNIGYDSRDYLTSLVISDIEQFEFYQGMIHQKGAVGAFNKLLRSTYIAQSGNLNFFEEWAILLNQFGAVNTTDRIAFYFGQSDIVRDPQYVQFAVNGANTVVANPNLDWNQLTDSSVTGLDPNWVERPKNPLVAFPRRNSYAAEVGDYPVSGYVRLNEVGYTVFYSSDVPSLYVANANSLATSEVIWIHSNQATRDVSNSLITNWYVVGNAVGNSGVWTVSNSVSLNYGYIANNANGQFVFRSHVSDGPYATNDDAFKPYVGQTYQASFMVQKTSNDANAYLKPGFLAANATSFTDGLGIVSGQGYSIANNIIDTSSWTLNTFYPVSVIWTCQEPSVSAFARILINPNLSNAVFEVSSQTLTLIEGPKWDTLNIYNMSSNGNPNFISNVVTNSELPTISNTILIVNTLYPHGLIPEDQGLYIVVDGMSLSMPELQGVQTLYEVLSPNSFSLNLAGTKGYDVPSGQYGPELRIMRSTHFSNLDQINQIQNGLSGQLVYIDGSPWAVYKLNFNIEKTTDWSGNIITTTSEIWEQYRVQPMRIDGSRIQASLIYDIKTLINATETAPQPLELDYMAVVSPLTGILPGEAISQIDYVLEYDPAKYSDALVSGGTGAITTFPNVDINQWGINQIGRVWWDVSTVRFLETETDNVSYGLDEPSRYNSEVSYRVANWGQIAPATSVDVYEWVQSIVNPMQYTNLGLTDTTGQYSGTIYNANFPSWVEQVQYDPTYGNVTYYYFWVKNRTIVPPVNFRNITAYTIASLITNPLSEDIPWISPVMDNGLMVGGVQTYVNDAFGTVSGTVLQVEVDNHGVDSSGYRDEGVIHDQWQLLRPNDETSLPSDWLWAKMRDSLVGFDDNKVSTPSNTMNPNITPPNSLPPVWQTPSGNLPNTSGHAPLTYSGDSFLATLIAVDPQGNPMLYYISNGSLPLGSTLNPQTGLISGTLTLENIDNEVDTSNYTWNFTVNAFNGVSYTPQSFSITVNVNHPPVWVTNAGLIASAYTGNAISYQLLATDPQSDALTYSITNSTLPSSLTLYSNGLIFGSYPPITAPPANTIVDFSVNVTNGFYTVERDFEIESLYVSLPPVWQYPASGSIGLFDQNTSQDILMLANSPGLLSVTYSIANGALPAGLTISSNSIVGTVGLLSNATEFDFTVKAMDSIGAYTNRDFSISITGNQPPVWATPAGSIGSGFIANSFSFQLVAATPEGHPTPLAYTISNGALPIGMTMNTTGFVSGILPIVSNTSTYYFTVTASDGVVGVSRNFSVTSDIPVAYPPLWTTPAGNLGSGASGDTVSLTLIATDFDSLPLTYSVTAGSLPTGLSLSNSANTAIISGTLGAIANTVVPFTVAVTDGISIVPQSFTYTIANPAPVTLGFANSTTFTVPSGIHNVMFTWVIAGGGGGSEGTQGGNGAGGSGGGGGGYYHYYGNVACNPGDIFTFNIGGHGYGGRYPTNTGLTPPPNATNGGDTVILLNGNNVVMVGGGGGAPSATNTGIGFINTPGGLAGTPNGIAGYLGPAGTSDTSSPTGGAGATGPLANSVGGLSGTPGSGGDPAGPTAGANAAYSGVFQAGPAVGYGSGGGGSAVSDRAVGSIGWWWGGDGAPGYVEITFPSQGAVGGTPAGSTIVLNEHDIFSDSIYPENAAASILFINDHDSYYPSAANGSVVEMTTHGITSTSTVYTADWNPQHEPASNYEIQAVYVSSTRTSTIDTTAFGTTLNTWYNLGANHFTGYNLIAVAHHSGDVDKQITLQVNIRRVSDGVIVASNIVNLEAFASGIA